MWRFRSINRRENQREDSTYPIGSLLRLQLNRTTTATAMAPTMTRQITYSEQNLSLTKVKKPAVEKMRRDRINTSIEQLKSLLAPEFLLQQPDSKQEKADILEMTVYFLSRQQQAGSSSTVVANGSYSHCVQEAVSFLSQCEVKTQSHSRLLTHFHSLQTSSQHSQAPRSLSPLGSPIDQATTKGVMRPISHPLWRPW
ncbi:transcription factor HES-5-like [Oncorhynchus mykiss]|uniref:BHLH domain-containing protein n=4 Tax=Oncorhynchus TaxID=8016 RepID=A0A8C7QBG0_ONCMY|nr:transcription factor HES-5-like [Oncorhynchus mykiss]